MPVTMKDIAKKAGVARTTVSMVLNNNPASYVSEAKKEKIIRIAREQNYQPNYSAISLRQGKTNCIGLLSSHALTFSNLEFMYHYSQISAGIEDGIIETGNNYTLMSFGSNLKRTYDKSLQLIQRRVVDGLVLMVLSFELEEFSRSLLPILRSSDLPFVVIHATGADLPYNNIGVDSYYCGYTAAEHFISLGYNDIGMYVPNPRAPRLLEVQEGFKNALQKNKLPWKILYRSEHNLEKGIIPAQGLPRAILIPDDYQALGIIERLREKGIRVPDDVAIIGFNDINLDRNPENILTTFHHPIAEKGVEAVRILTGILDGQLEPDQVHQKIFKPELIIRKTCGNK